MDSDVNLVLLTTVEANCFVGWLLPAMFILQALGRPTRSWLLVDACTLLLLAVE
jgi:hypothetical protein